MKKRTLGRTGIAVSEICLGSMTWGEQNTAEEGQAQIDMALDHGIDFIDTAELYSTIPVRPETYGRTEEIIGDWLEKSRRRNDIVLATKISGGGTKHIRGGARVDAKSIREALDASLKRLKTDHIDLYQIHNPPRGHYHFRRMWGYDPSGQDTADTTANMLECLEEFDRQIQAGKIRAIGLSNETCWGTAKFLQLADAHGLPRVATVQNEYSLMYRNFDLDLAELSHHEDVGLLAYSPLAAGLLTGKYSGNAIPPGSRGEIQKGMNGRSSESSRALADAYCALARENGLDPVQMALAFCLTRPFMASVILGATSLDQLRTALGTAHVTLSKEVLDRIDALHKVHPQPF